MEPADVWTSQAALCHRRPDPEGLLSPAVYLGHPGLKITRAATAREDLST